MILTTYYKGFCLNGCNLEYKCHKFYVTHFLTNCHNGFLSHVKVYIFVHNRIYHKFHQLGDPCGDISIADCVPHKCLPFTRS